LMFACNTVADWAGSKIAEVVAQTPERLPGEMLCETMTGVTKGAGTAAAVVCRTDSRFFPISCAVIAQDHGEKLEVPLRIGNFACICRSESASESDMIQSCDCCWQKRVEGQVDRIGNIKNVWYIGQKKVTKFRSAGVVVCKPF
jgi:hypothetical protein